MTHHKLMISSESAINASWTRCQQQYKLSRKASHPIMRLQSTEIAPRLESLLERTEGCHGVFENLAKSVASVGNCLVITDESGILVRLDSNTTKRGTGDWNGIALGSCWDERIAGTNGVAMALLEGQTCTVRGPDHFFSKLARFSCTATPILDAENQVIGVLNMSAIDRNHLSDYLFATHLLGAAADRIQRCLFERKFQDARIISLSIPDSRYLFRGDEMIAIDAKGIIVGSTAKAHSLLNLHQPKDLKGKSFELLFATDARRLDIPEQVVRTTRDNGTAVNLRRHVHINNGKRNNSKRHSPTERHSQKQIAHEPGLHHRHSYHFTPSINELSIGSKVMQASCIRANQCFHRAIPFLIEGASGTGKSALIAALHEEANLTTNQILTIDCASLGKEQSDRHYFRTVIEQARAVESLAAYENRISTMVLDNIDELPKHAQATLRKLLSEMELWEQTTRHTRSSGLRIIASCSQKLIDAVEKNRFRDDLYYLLAGTVILLPSLNQREHVDKIVRSLANNIADSEVEISEEALQALLAYEWPGNVRQLRSVLKQALIEGNGNRISLLDLSATPIIEENLTSTTTPATPLLKTAPLKYDEANLLTDALHSAQWNVSKAARSLGMSRATMHRKLKRHGIERPA